MKKRVPHHRYQSKLFMPDLMDSEYGSLNAQVTKSDIWVGLNAKAIMSDKYTGLTDCENMHSTLCC